MGARFYDPALGRWLSADTLVPEPGEPQSFNRYSYVRNSPLNRIDPSGHYDMNEVHHDLTKSTGARVIKNLIQMGPSLNTDLGTWTAKDIGRHHSFITGRALSGAYNEVIASENRATDLNLKRTSVDFSKRLDGRTYSEYYHFTSLQDAEARLQAAIEAKDPKAFGIAMHAYQDYWSHTRKGFSAEPGLAGFKSILKNCPECTTLMDAKTLISRSSRIGHGFPKTDWNDVYLNWNDPSIGDPDDYWMAQGTEYWLVMFFCELYGIDPQDYWDLYGEIEKPHE